MHDPFGFPEAFTAAAVATLMPRHVAQNGERCSGIYARVEVFGRERPDGGLPSRSAASAGHRNDVRFRPSIGFEDGIRFYWGLACSAATS
jgi:hypothetical protein